MGASACYRSPRIPASSASEEFCLTPRWRSGLVTPSLAAGHNQGARLGHIDEVAGSLIPVHLGAPRLRLVVEILLVGLAHPEGPAIKPLRLLAAGRLLQPRRRDDRDGAGLRYIQQRVGVGVLVD